MPHCTANIFASSSWTKTTPDLVKVYLVKNPDLVKQLLQTILLLLCSKKAVDLVKNLDLVKFYLLTKNFNKTGVYCTQYILQCTHRQLPWGLSWAPIDRFQKIMDRRIIYFEYEQKTRKSS